MEIKAVLFDIDGTLLPMDNDVFTSGYFKELAKKLAPLGITPDELIPAIWKGTGAMTNNEGTRLNCDVFWDTFTKVTGKESEPFKSASNEFYANEFDKAKAFTQENPYAKTAVEIVKQSGKIAVCASNPLFPINGQVMRLSWLGLKPDDFAYLTSYESESYSKPNPKFYLSVSEKIGVLPENCLYIGNDEYDDMWAASTAGMNCFLVTDCLTKSENYSWNGPSGSFSELIDYLKTV